MTALLIDHMYQYPCASCFNLESRELWLSTSWDEVGAYPHFFEGTLAHPQRTAKLLLGLMSVVQARFHVPAAMLGRIIALADPIVTCSDERLRFEGFSGCCGVYARVDLHPGSLAGTRFGRGTTNVDFNQPMLSALAMVRDTDDVSLSVGRDEFSLEANTDSIIEKKVRLPFRWLKGLVEVQACQQRMEQQLEISGPEAVRFLRSLPRMKTNRRETWIVPSGRGLRISQVKPPRHGVRVGGLERLRVLERLAPQANALRIYADAVTGATGWELVFEDCRFHIVISPEVWRGFSGEGQSLESFADSAWEQALPKVQANLSWHPVIDIDDLAQRSGISIDLARQSLAVLGTRGLVGYDLGEASYFHRELPFDLSAIDMMQPRLRSARKLHDEGKVHMIEREPDVAEAAVSSGDISHRVRLAAEKATCTCPWYAKHQDERGPCKHILAVRMTIEEASGE